MGNSDYIEQYSNEHIDDKDLLFLPSNLMT